MVDCEICGKEPATVRLLLDDGQIRIGANCLKSEEWKEKHSALEWIDLLYKRMYDSSLPKEERELAKKMVDELWRKVIDGWIQRGIQKKC